MLNGGLILDLGFGGLLALNIAQPLLARVVASPRMSSGAVLTTQRAKRSMLFVLQAPSGHQTQKGSQAYTAAEISRSTLCSLKTAPNAHSAIEAG